MQMHTHTHTHTHIHAAEWQVMCVFKALHANPNDTHSELSDKEFYDFYEVQNLKWRQVSNHEPPKLPQGRGEAWGTENKFTVVFIKEKMEIKQSALLINIPSFIVFFTLEK